MKLLQVTEISWWTSFIPILSVLSLYVGLFIFVLIATILEARKSRHLEGNYKYSTPPPKPSRSGFRQRLEEAQKQRAQNNISEIKQRISIHK